MCLTPEAFALFLNMLNPQMISTEAGRITVHAEIRDTVWIQMAEDWCTFAPQLDRLARFD